MTIELGKRYRVFLVNRFQYEGEVLATTDADITILDFKTNTEVTLVRKNIGSAELVEGQE